jgi:hypothetical protein
MEWQQREYNPKTEGVADRDNIKPHTAIEEQRNLVPLDSAEDVEIVECKSNPAEHQHYKK